jgi:hypothetical protein
MRGAYNTSKTRVSRDFLGTSEIAGHIAMRNSCTVSGCMTFLIMTGNKRQVSDEEQKEMICYERLNFFVQYQVKAT